jgi:hypothetical protein
MRKTKWIAGAGGVLLLGGAFAQNPGDRPTAAKGLEQAVMKARLLRQEEEKFDLQHPLKGQIADGAMRKLQTAGYKCKFDTLELTRIAKGTSVTLELYKTPIIACVQHASEPSDICAQRRVTLVVDWQDERLPDQQSQSQILSRPIVNRGFWCVEQGEVVHH